MKHILSILFVVSLFATASAQDIIYTRRITNQPSISWTEIKAKVLEINLKTIVYKKAENPDGPVYRLHTADVDSIVFENGSVEIFEKPIRKHPFSSKDPVAAYARYTEKKRKEQATFKNLPPNMLSAGIGVSGTPEVNFVSASFAGRNDKATFITYITFERMMVHQRLGINISPFIGWNQKSYGASVTAKAYTSNAGRVRFGLGPMYTFSSRDWVDIYYDDKSRIYVRKRTRGIVSALAFNTNLQVHVNRRTFISTELFLGRVTGFSNREKHIPAYWKHYDNEHVFMGAKLGAGIRL
ncbi:MAG: hypothetical protein QM594_02380 [Niabella sp.]